MFVFQIGVMGSYEAEQKKLQALWNELLSDEESNSEFGDVYLSDGYSPSGTESSDSAESSSSLPKKKLIKIDKGKQTVENSGASTSRQGILDNRQDNIIDQVIQDVISEYTVETDESENENDIQVSANTDDLCNLQWRPVDGMSLKNIPFVPGDVGISNTIYADFYNKEPIDIFKLFLTDDIILHMVNETNRYAEQRLLKNTMPKSRIKKWIPTDKLEMEKFLGILLWMGLCRFPTLRSPWKKGPLYFNQISKLMSRNRFELLLSMWHFSNNEDDALENDRLRKITPLVTKLVERFQALYTPGKNICIDETMVPFRGRLRFKQFIKNKRHKFGIKVYKLCCQGGYTYNLKVYCGSDCTEGGQASANVVFYLMEKLLNEGRHLYTDNYYTSVYLATELLKKKYPSNWYVAQ